MFMYNIFIMPRYQFRCPSEECGNIFDVYMSAEEYTDIHACPDCQIDAKRVFTTISVHHGRTLSQKKAGASLKTIEHGKFIKDARDKRKKNYGPESREGQSNELWVGTEVQDGVVNAPEKNKKV
jgi:putative FmdB family regulatory protein